MVTTSAQMKVRDVPGLKAIQQEAGADHLHLELLALHDM